jgi:hypothetical protein
MMTAVGFNLMSIKVFLIFIIIMLTNPVGTNLMMIAAINHQDYQEYNEKLVRKSGHIDWPDEPVYGKPDKPDEPKPAPSVAVKPEKKDPDIPDKPVEPQKQDKPNKPNKPYIEIPSDKVITDRKKADRKRQAPKPSMKRSKAELTEIAIGMGIDVPETATKKVILEMINAASETADTRTGKAGSAAGRKSGGKKSAGKKSGGKTTGGKKTEGKKTEGKQDAKKSGGNRSGGRKRSSGSGKGTAKKTSGQTEKSEKTSDKTNKVNKERDTEH